MLKGLGSTYFSMMETLHPSLRISVLLNLSPMHFVYSTIYFLYIDLYYIYIYSWQYIEKNSSDLSYQKMEKNIIQTKRKTKIASWEYRDLKLHLLYYKQSNRKAKAKMTRFRIKQRICVNVSLFMRRKPMMRPCPIYFIFILIIRWMYFGVFVPLICLMWVFDHFFFIRVS